MSLSSNFSVRSGGPANERITTTFEKKGICPSLQTMCVINLMKNNLEKLKELTTKNQFPFQLNTEISNFLQSIQCYSNNNSEDKASAVLARSPKLPALPNTQPLFIASSLNNIFALQYFLRMKNDYVKIKSHHHSQNLQKNSFKNALIFAIRFDNTEAIELLYNKFKKYYPDNLKSFLNDALEDRQSPLEEAIERGHKVAFITLLELGADINAKNNKKETILFFALKHKKIEIIKIILKNINLTNLENLDEKLAAVAYCDMLDYVIPLIELGAKINSITYKQTPLMYTSEIGSVEVINRLLSKIGPEKIKEYIDYRHDDLTALDYAIINRKRHAAIALIKLGASFTCNTLIHNSSLIEAAKSGHEDIIENLLSNGADQIIEFANHFGETPLLITCEYGHENALKMLISYKANPNAKTNANRTALIYTAHYGHTSLAKILIDQKVDVNAQDKDGQSALMFAASNGNTELIHLLCENNAKVNMKDNAGRTALMLATMNAHPKAVEELLKYQANVNDIDDRGNTALTYAAFTDPNQEEFPRQVLDGSSGSLICLSNMSNNDYKDKFSPIAQSDRNIEVVAHEKVMQILIMANATFGPKTIYDFLTSEKIDDNYKAILICNLKNLIPDLKKYLIHFAMEDNLKLSNLLLKCGVKDDEGVGELILEFQKISSPREMKEFLEKNNNFALMTLLSSSFVTEEYKLNMLDTIKILGIDINQYIISFAEASKLDALKILFKNGADVNKRSIWGKTTLMIAAETKNIELVYILLGKEKSFKIKADLDLQDSLGHTALMLACTVADNLPIIKALVEAKADLFLENHNHRTALDIANETSKKTAEYLQDKMIEIVENS